MGTFRELLNKKPNAKELGEKRKTLIAKIQQETGRKLLIYAADVNFKGDSRDSMISVEDRTAFVDLVESVKAGSEVDMVVETPGGYIEAVEDFVHILRSRFKGVRFIIPNIAKSAGTILVMSGDELLMDYRSTLGPIDAQINFKGKSFAAQSFLEGFRKIVDTAEKQKKLSRAYIPLLQNISPADIQSCEDADRLSEKLVAKWLETYMLAGDKEPAKKAAFIAGKLCDHSHWLSHGRSIRIDDLQKWDVKVADYSKYKKLSKYIWDLWIHIFWSFQSNIFKIFESEKINTFRTFNPGSSRPQPITPDQAIKQADAMMVENECPKCGNMEKFHLKFSLKLPPPPEPGIKPFPKNDKYVCEKCGANIDISKIRLDMEDLKGAKAIF